MTDFVLKLVADYGERGLGYVLGVLAIAALWAIARLKLSQAVREGLDLLGHYAANAVKVTFQTYVSGIKAGREDGTLTPQEQREAFNRARDYFLSQLNWRQLLKLGGGLLLRIFGADKWRAKLENAVAGFIETHVANAKLAGKAVSGPTLTAAPLQDSAAPSAAPAPSSPR